MPINYIVVCVGGVKLNVISVINSVRKDVYHAILVVVISRDLTSDSLYLRCPPRVLMDVNLPAFAHLVTVFGSTRNKIATSEGVSKTSCSLLNYPVSNLG